MTPESIKAQLNGLCAETGGDAFLTFDSDISLLGQKYPVHIKFYPYGQSEYLWEDSSTHPITASCTTIDKAITKVRQKWAARRKLSSEQAAYRRGAEVLRKFILTGEIPAGASAPTKSSVLYDSVVPLDQAYRIAEAFLATRSDGERP